MPDQESVEDLGGTLRLGSYPCVLAKDSNSYRLFGRKEIRERHRHRYEVNNAFRDELAEKGMKIAGTSPDNHIVEMVEVKGHPFLSEHRDIRNLSRGRIMCIRYSEDLCRRQLIVQKKRLREIRL